MDSPNGIMKNSSFWTNLFKASSGKTDLQDVFKSMPTFEKLSKSQINNLTKLTHNRFYETGEYIFHQGDPGIGLYVIREGEVSISQSTPENIEYDLIKFNRGDFFGEMALLDNERRSASAIATRDSTLAVLFKPDLDEFINRYPKVGVEIMKGMAQIIATRLRNVNQEYLALYTKMVDNN
ncbi:MAG: cyclic nucleotide-binding domain-containing protein [Bacteroidetes bacterium]|nr:cyclic nucleotide-binding domain-containing protein [Bacteroidota bacterium]